MDVKDKFSLIRKIKEMMAEKRLQRLFLDKPLSLKEPDRDNPFSVSEICIDQHENVVAWCHWDKRDCGLKLEYFHGNEVQLVERMVEQTLCEIKHYRVPVTAYIDIFASSESNAIKTAKVIANLQGALDKNDLILYVENDSHISIVE